MLRRKILGYVRAMLHVRWYHSHGQQKNRVIVCGGGPTGLSTALLLAKYGVPSLVLERENRLPEHPKAHCINHRTMEVFRGMSEGLSDEVANAMPPMEQWRSFVYCSGSLLGARSLLGAVDHFKGQCGPDEIIPRNHLISPEPVAHLPQHQLVPMLANRAKMLPELIDFRMNQNVIDFDMNTSSVSVTIECDGKQEVAQGSYLVAADGAHSGIRKSLGIDMDGPGTLQYLINIYFTSPSLGESLIHTHRMGMLYFIFGLKNIVVLVAHNLEKGEFVAQVPFFPPLQDAKEFDENRCKEIIEQISGGNSTDVQVHNAKPWAMGAAVATHYRKGNVFLAGDAAHIVPPAGAFGMNTGIQDAHNLAWKLSRSLAGKREDADALLDSYQAERKPVAIANMNLSVDNFHEALRVAKIIGLDFETAQSINSVLNGPLSSWAPDFVRRQVLNTAMSSGLLLGQALATTRRKELSNLFKSGETLRLQYPKEDVGFLYSGKASHLLVERELRSALEKAAKAKPRNAPYVPICLPGFRFPHFPVSILESRQEHLQPGTEVVSSIDIPAATGIDYTLFVSHSSAEQWRVMYDKAGVVSVEVKTDSSPLVSSSSGHCPSVLAREINSPSMWDSLVKPLEKAFGSSPGILIRPDGHVAWIGPCSRYESALVHLQLNRFGRHLM